MSATAVHLSKRVRRACQHCRARKARFQHGGSVRADRDHTLCFACYRAARERRRAQLLAAGPHPASQGPHQDDRREPVGLEARRAAAEWRPPLAGRATLTARQLEHRRRMLRHLEIAARGSSPAAARPVRG